jgi:hypothetical protein
MAAGLFAATQSPALATVDAANAYVTRTFPATYPWQALSFQVKVEQTNDATGYFYATQFGLTNGNLGYGGLQTQLYENGINQGRGAIFSIFGATGCAAVAGGCFSFTEGGGGWSIKWPYPWSVGASYQMSFFAHNTNGVFTGQIDATLTLVGYGSQFMGTINVPTTWGGFGQTAVQWTEQYVPASYNACTDIAVSKAVFNGAVTVTPSYPPASFYPIATSTSIQSGTGCSNSAIIDLGGGVGPNDHAYREIVGATS